MYNDSFEEGFIDNFNKKIKMNGIPEEALKYYDKANYVSLMKGAVDYADALIVSEENVNSEVLEYVKDSGKPVLEYQGEENYFDAYNQFYDQIIGEN